MSSPVLLRALHAYQHIASTTSHKPSHRRVFPLTQPLAHSVSVSQECISSFNELKLGKSTKWIIYKISDDWKSIEVEETSQTADYEQFREKLVSAKSKGKNGKEGPGPRYAIYDFEYEVEEGAGKR